MIVIRLKLPLEQAEYSALLRAASDELRDPVDQVHFILRQELQRHGLLNNPQDQTKQYHQAGDCVEITR